MICGRQLLTLSIAACVLSLPAMAADDHNHGGSNWSYHGAKSAQNWGDLSVDYHTCKVGTSQSPVNVSEYAKGDVEDLAINYGESKLHVVNNGHTIQTNFDPGSTLSVKGKTYNLLQAHFHTPSEHYIDGAPYPMEAHFVHQAEDQSLAVIGVMMKIGKSNPVVQGIWQNIPATHESKSLSTVTYSPAMFLPENKSYYHLQGSLTTPPCSEGVQWYIMQEPIEISEGQLAAFQRFYPVNARPLQDLNERIVIGN